MATIKDLARRAGVGLGTVSRVINGGKGVSPRTYEKVMAAARELDFHPHAGARSLARREYTRRTLGVVMPVAVHPFYFEILKGIYQAVTELHYNVMIFNLGEDRGTVYDHILAESLPGLLVIAHTLPPEVRDQLHASAVPFYYVDYHDPEEACYYVDNVQGGRLAARYLLDQGCRRLVYIGEDSDTQQQDDRYGGFLEVLQEQGLQPLGDIRVPIRDRHGLEATLQALESWSPDGIFYFCDELAYGGLQARRRSGLHPLILGYDDREASQYMGLSTIAQPAQAMGYSATRDMVHSLQKNTRNTIQKSFIPALVLRDD